MSKDQIQIVSLKSANEDPSSPKEFVDRWRSIRLNRIIESPDNPRKTYSETSLQELAETIIAHGVLQPIKVRPLPLMGDDSDPTYEVIFGHRRLRASKIAGLDSIPAMVEEMSDEQADRVRLVENIQREQVNPVEEADAIVRMADKHGIAKEEVGKTLGMSRTTVYNKIKLASAHEAVRKKCADGVIGGEIATHIARLPKAVQQIALQKVIVNQPDPDSPDSKKAVALPLEQAKQILKGNFTIKIEAADFKPESESLLPCGACTRCDKLSDNDPALLADLGAGTCTDTDCFEKKTQAHYQAEIDNARLTGTRVIEGEEAFAIWASPYSNFLRGWTNIDGLAPFKVKLIEGDEEESATYRDLIEMAGEEAPKPVLIVNPHDKPLHSSKLAYSITDEAAKALANKFRPERPEGDDDDDEEDSDPPAAPLTQEEQAVADHASWQRIKLAIARKAATRKRTTDDLRMVLAFLAEICGEVPETVAHVMGWSQDELPQTYGGELDFVQERTRTMTADQLGTLLMTWIIDNAPFTSSHHPGDIRAAKLELAARYGVDVIEAGAEPKAEPEPAAKQEDQEQAQSKAVPPAVKAKYRNPITGESWTGRGLQPKWVQAAIASGKRLEDFLTVKPITLTDDEAPDDAGLAEADEQASQQAA